MRLRSGDGVAFLHPRGNLARMNVSIEPDSHRNDDFIFPDNDEMMLVLCSIKKNDDFIVLLLSSLGVGWEYESGLRKIT